jgi:hypothetical protein
MSLSLTAYTVLLLKLTQNNLRMSEEQEAMRTNGLQQAFSNKTSNAFRLKKR